MPDPASPAPPAPPAAIGRGAVKGEAAGRRGEGGDRRRCEDAVRARLPDLQGRRSAPRNRLPFRRNPLISQDRRKYKFPQISAADGVPPRRGAEASPPAEAVSLAGAVRGAEKRPRPAVAAAPDARRRLTTMDCQRDSAIRGSPPARDPAEFGSAPRPYRLRKPADGAASSKCGPLRPLTGPQP